MQYLSEIKEIVKEYDKIGSGLDELEKLTKMLDLRKLELEQALANNKQKEKALIDKIIAETGKAPDYFEIMTKLNEIT
jgi:hypothetical protein